MTKKLSKKIMSLFISLAILVGCVSVIGIGSAFASDFKEGTYTGDVSNYIEAMGGINTNYSISISFVDGDYTYDVKVQVPMMGYDDYDDTETGTYTVNGDNIVFNGGNLTSAKITDEGKIVITGILSSFASSTSSAELSMTSEDKPSTGAVYEDKLVSGKYELTKDSYPESAMMKMDAIITIDREAKVFSTQRNGAEKSTGTISFDEYTGVYTVNYTEVAPEGATVTFTYDENGITFTSPLYFGSVKMNTLDDDGNFIPYTANHVKTYEDKLVSGKYELTKDSYPESAMMKMDAIITIDREAKVFSTQRNGAEKSTGTISFDEYTGVYTVNYTEVAPEGATVTFTYDENGITFTSPLYFGSVKMNTLDDDGNFIPYTANSVKEDEPNTFADTLKSGVYELTEDSYISISPMKLAATVTIDRETNTFSTQRNGAEKGTGTISFDEYTGVYTVNYTEYAPEDASVTFTFSDDGITFTSPLYFGSVRMNTLDDDGNFAPYTANLIKDVTSPDDTDVTKPDDTDVTKPDDTDVTAPDNSSTADDNNTDVATPDNSDADAADNTVDNSNKAGNATSPATGNSFSTQALIVLVVLCGMSLASVVVLFDRKKKALNK